MFISTRRLFRGLIWSLPILTIVWLMICYWQRDPEYYWQCASSALDRHDDERAELHLRNLLRLAPDHGPGHIALYKILQRRAAGIQGAEAESLQREFKHHLLRAEALTPDSPLLQADLFAYYRGRDQAKVRTIAKRLIVVDPNHTEAILVLVRHAVTKPDRQVGPLITKLIELKGEQSFEVPWLAVRLNGMKGNARISLLQNAWQRISALDALQFAGLNQHERAAVLQLLLYSIESAQDAVRAEARCWHVVKTIQRLTPPDADASTWHESAAIVGQALTHLRQKTGTKTENPGESVSPLETQIVQKVIEVQSQALERGTPPLSLREQFSAILLQEGQAERALQVAQPGVTRQGQKVRTSSLGETRLCFLIARALLQLQREEEAEQYLLPVRESALTAEDLRGWANLLQGTIENGRQNHFLALQYYEKARRQLGHNLQIDVCFAAMECDREQWRAAMPHLQRIKGRLSVASVLERQWAERRGFEPESVDWWLFRACLGDDHWHLAKTYLKQFVESELEVRAEIAACGYLWDRGQQQESLYRLIDVRRKFPDSMALFDLEFRFRVALQDWYAIENLFRTASAALKERAEWQILAANWHLLRASADQDLQRDAAQLSRLYQDQPAQRLADMLGVLAPLTRPAPVPLTRTVSTGAEPFKSEGKSHPQPKTVISLAEDALRSAQACLAIRIPDRDYATFAENQEKADHRPILTTALLRYHIARLLPIALASDRRGVTVSKLKAFLAEETTDPFWVGLQAELFLAAGNLTASLEKLAALAALLPHSPTPRLWRAQVLLRHGQREAALADLQRAMEADPRDMRAKRLAAKVALELNRLAEARQWASSILQEDAKAWPLYLIVAECDRKENRVSEAIVMMKDLIQRNPNYLEAYRMLVVLTNDGQGPDKALQLCRKVRQRFPSASILARDENHLAQLVSNSAPVSKPSSTQPHRTGART